MRRRSGAIHSKSQEEYMKVNQKYSNPSASINSKSGDTQELVVISFNSSNIVFMESSFS